MAVHAVKEVLQPGWRSKVARSEWNITNLLEELDQTCGSHCVGASPLAVGNMAQFADARAHSVLLPV